MKQIKLSKEEEKEFDEKFMDSDGTIHMGGSRITELYSHLTHLKEKWIEEGMNKVIRIIEKELKEEKELKDCKDYPMYNDFVKGEIEAYTKLLNNLTHQQD